MDILCEEKNQRYAKPVENFFQSNTSIADYQNIKNYMEPRKILGISDNLCEALDQKQHRQNDLISQIYWYGYLNLKNLKYKIT